jgi:anaerobic selenocysteine-containing dehydrogenase
MSAITAPTFCRNCSAFCPVVVTVEDGRAVKVIGDPDSDVYEGYLCPKGRIMPEQHYDPSRLLRSLKRQPDGGYAPISSDEARREIVEKLKAILAAHGPSAVAAYTGVGTLPNMYGPGMASALLRALGSPMNFWAATIDKPAEKVSVALHGNWHAGPHRFESSDAWIIVGANPVIAKSNGAPSNNPGVRLKKAQQRGMKLIVIDPRKTETSKRAQIHLQPVPGEDPTILAGIAHVIIAEGLVDRDFLDNNADGFEDLRAAVAPYTPDYVAARAGISAADLIEAARAFGRARRGSVVCSTGPSFSTRSNLTFYLALCLNTLCGRWTREGEIAPYPNVLLPAYRPRAQALAPYDVYGARQLANGMRENASGMPSAGLADQILTNGPDQVRALFCIGGNPMRAWPDSRRTEAALGKLDLLVTLDVTQTPTTRLADYVIAAPQALEIPGTTLLIELGKFAGSGRGWHSAWAQYSPAIVAPPEGSDVVSEHAFFFQIAQDLGLQLEWINSFGFGPHAESPTEKIPLDMSRTPSLDDMIELSTRHAHVPLETVKAYPHGARFELPMLVEGPDPDRHDRLQVGDPMMMAELADIRAEDYRNDREARGLPFFVVSRRTNIYNNSILSGLPSNVVRMQYNPAHMHPDDMARLDLKSGDTVRLRARHNSVFAVAEPDETLRPGVIALSHGFGPASPDRERDARDGGANVNVLIDLDEPDPVSGIPRMSAIPVAVERA